MEPRILRPIKKIIELSGRISYDEHNGAWSRIRLKKEFINEFPDLTERRSNFSYKLLFYRTYLELDKIIKVMKKENKPLPILLFLVKEKEAIL